MLYQIRLRNGKPVLDINIPIRELKKTVIYLIRNKINGKVWVGQAVNFYNRSAAHLSKLSKGISSRHIQSAWDKYGYLNFEFEIIESELQREDLVFIESKYIEKFKSWDREFGYNIERYDRRGIRVVSEESKKKVSLSLKGLRKGISTGPMADDIKKKISETLKGTKKPEGFCRGDKNPQYGKNGELNSQYGKKWYMDPITGESKKYLSNEQIPIGWIPGRRILNRRKKC